MYEESSLSRRRYFIGSAATNASADQRAAKRTRAEDAARCLTCRLIESREIESSSSVERCQFSRHFPCVLPSSASPRGRRPACRQRPIVDIRKGRRDWRGREPTANRDQEKENSRSPLFLGSPRLCPGRTPVARPLPSRHVLATYT